MSLRQSNLLGQNEAVSKGKSKQKIAQKEAEGTKQVTKDKTNHYRQNKSLRTK